MQTEGSLKGRYDKLSSERDPYLTRARDCAKVTIPTLFPPDGATGSTKLPTPYQSIGARGLNNLAAKLLLALLPPNSPFFRLMVDDFMLERMTGQEGMRADVEEALSRMERSVMGEIESRPFRTALFEALKLLLVSGNVLAFVLPDGGMKVFRLDRYVIKRDPTGNLLELITKERISDIELPEEVRAVVQSKRSSSDGKPNTEDTSELYTCCRRTNTGWEVFQEVNGLPVPGSEGTYPLKKSPWLALRFIAVDGEDYGRGFVEEYLGDLKSLEGLTKAIVQGSAAAAKVLFLVRPNSTTKYKTLAESESGDIKEGNRDDIGVLQLDKYADFRVANDTRAGLIESLSFAFLLNTAIQRNGERVTAEEIRYMANELESALGGVYSTLSQELQLPLVIRVMFQMERQGRLPMLPEGVIRPTITTGIEAIGRGNDLTKLAGLLQDISPLGPEVVSTHLNVGDYIKRCGTARGIDMKGLIPTAEEIAAKNQQAQMMALVQQLGPNSINQLGNVATTAMQTQAQPQ